MKTTLTITRWAVLALLVLQAAAAQAIDLVGAYEHASRYYPTRLAADDALDAGHEKALQGDALLRPRVNLQSSVSRIDDRSSGTSPAVRALIPSGGMGTASQAAVQLVQPLYDATAHAERRQLHQQSILAESQFLQARQDLVQRVAEVYFGVLIAKETLRVTQAERAAGGVLRDRAQARFEIGRGSITELQEATARYDAVVTKEISAESTLELRRAQFAETIGVPAQGLANLAPEFVPRPLESDSLEAWQLKGENQNTHVLVKREELETANAEVGKHRLASRPTPDLVGSYTAKNQHGSLSFLVAPDGNRIGALGLQLNVPLYAGGALDSREREPLAKRRQAEQQLAMARRDVRLQVQEFLLSVRTGIARIASLGQSLASARSALEATTLGRDIGTRNELDVLDAQQRVFAAELDLTQARFDYLLGRVRLAAAAGELAENDLRLLNGWLVP